MRPIVVILGHGFWRRLGGRAGIIGETLVLDDVPHTIVGVMPEDFRVEVFDVPDDVYRPGDAPALRGGHSCVPGVSRHRPAAAGRVDTSRRRVSGGHGGRAAGA